MEHSKIGRDFIIANIKCQERQIILEEKKEKRSRMEEAGSHNSAGIFWAPAAPWALGEALRMPKQVR